MRLSLYTFFSLSNNFLSLNEKPTGAAVAVAAVPKKKRANGRQAHNRAQDRYTDRRMNWPLLFLLLRAATVIARLKLSRVVVQVTTVMERRLLATEGICSQRR